MEVCLPVPEAVCRLRWRYSIIIHMRMTVTAHILITAAIRYSGELFFNNRDFAGDCFVSFVIYDFCRKCGIGRRMQIFYGEQRTSDKCFKGVLWIPEWKIWKCGQDNVFRDLFILLWTLLLIVPGIIKSYSYRLVPYILSENPHMDRKRALELSQQMMDGHKMEAFVLELSFFGWFLLSALTCGLVGIFYVNPYLDATFAEFYVAIRTESIGKGLVAEGELPGYSAQTV